MFNGEAEIRGVMQRCRESVEPRRVQRNQSDTTSRWDKLSMASKLGIRKAEETTTKNRAATYKVCANH